MFTQEEKDYIIKLAKKKDADDYYTRKGNFLKDITDSTPEDKMKYLVGAGLLGGATGVGRVAASKGMDLSANVLKSLIKNLGRI